MIRRAVVLLALSFSLLAEERWAAYRSGPFQVLSSAGERGGKETLGKLEQFRWTFGKIFGRDDPTTVWPIRILVFKKYEGPTALALDRDAYTAGVIAGAPLSSALLRGLATIFMDTGPGRLPQSMERGLQDLFSTLEVKGVHITLGAPPSDKSLAWARIQMLVVNPEYYGRIPVLIHNLERSTEPDVAYRNAFAKSSQDIDKQAAAYLATGQFQTAEISGRPLNAERDFIGRPVDPDAAAAYVADLAATRQAYAALLAKYPNLAAAHEGLGFAELKDKHTDAARQEFTDAGERNSASARAWLEYARLETDRDKARDALEKAAQLNANWAEPWFLLAERAAETQSKIKFLKNATRIEPRNATYWRALAESDIDANDYADAAKAWAGAERASADDAERAHMVKARTDLEQQRLDYIDAERRRDAAEKARELQNVKNAALERIREAEAKANQSLGAGKPPISGKVEPYWEGPLPSGKVEGVLLSVTCTGRKAVLVIQGENRKLTRLLVPDVSQLLVQGASNASLACGEQTAQRKVTVAYFPKVDRAAGSTGEAARIDFEP